MSHLIPQLDHLADLFTRDASYHQALVDVSLLVEDEEASLRKRRTLWAEDGTQRHPLARWRISPLVSGAPPLAALQAQTVSPFTDPHQGWRYRPMLTGTAATRPRSVHPGGLAHAAFISSSNRLHIGIVSPRG